MRLYTVKQVAKMAGVSVRALHHYDAIALLKPAKVGENGYRYYGRDELLRLQQILTWRELDLSLEAVGGMIDQAGVDRVAVLESQRAALAAKAARYGQLIATLDATLADLKGEKRMDDKELYQGYDPGKQAEYEAWLIDRYGDGMARQISDAWVKGAKEVDTPEAAARLNAEFAATERAIADAMMDGAGVEAGLVQAAVARHYAIVSRFWSPTAEGYAGLADLYLENPDFRKRYEAVESGLTTFLAAAMRVYATRELA
ncbi:MAG: transcriptional regulator [Caulobacteraceae bacterium]|nr:transcriptional regulator [Caulobacteraceae bacterium]